MNKNIKLLYCILGSGILSQLNNPIFNNSKYGLFSISTFTGQVVYDLSNVLAVIGFILLIIFSGVLIENNIDLNHK